MTAAAAAGRLTRYGGHWMCVLLLQLVLGVYAAPVYTVWVF